MTPHMSSPIPPRTPRASRTTRQRRRLLPSICPRPGAVLAAVLISFLLCAQEVRCDSSEAPDKVRLQLAWTHQFEFAGFYAAKAKGFYEREGFDVEILPGGTGHYPLEEVLSGRAEYGVAGSEVLLAFLRGSPVAALAPIFQHSAACLLVRNDSGITSPQNLPGHTVEMGEIETDAEIHAMLAAEGIRIDRLEPIPSTFTPANILAGNVDAISAYSTNQPFFLRQAGIDYGTIRPITYGIDFYGDTLFSSRREIETHPDRAERFLKASLDGWRYAISHVQETIDLILTEYSDFPYAHTRAHLSFEAEETISLLLPGVVEIGHMNPGRWAHMAATFARIGLAEPGRTVDGFIAFPPDEKLTLDHWAVKTGLAIAVLAVASSFLFMLFNMRLRKEIREKETVQEELKKAKIEAEAANEAKSFFLASMSHEIRTPLNGILGLTRYTLDSDTLPQSQREDLLLVEESARHLLHIINDILDLSKIRSGTFSLNRSDFPLHTMVRSVARFFIHQFDSSGVELRVHIDKKVPDRVHGDADRIRQILVNLLGNAYKFTEKGFVQLCLETDSTEKNLIFSVTDTGQGIPEEVRQQLFAPFSRPENSLTKTREGTGLGLAICKQLVEHMDGQISLRSEPGKGSTFSFSIPLIPADPATDDGEDSTLSDSGERLSLRGVSVLVAEDNRVNRVFMQHLLQREGCRVLIAEDGAGALEVLRRTKVDVVLMDLQMPVMDGLTAAGIIRKEIDPALPIIALSAHAMSGYEETCRAAGMNGYLSKPVDAAVLKQAIQQTLATA